MADTNDPIENFRAAMRGESKFVIDHTKALGVNFANAILEPLQKNNLELICEKKWDSDDDTVGKVEMRVRIPDSGQEEIIENDAVIPSRLFRPFLARIVAMCTRDGNQVSPYGGESEFAFGDDPTKGFRVTFSNTPGNQRIELTPAEVQVTRGKPLGDEDIFVSFAG